MYCIVTPWSGFEALSYWELCSPQHTHHHSCHQNMPENHSRHTSFHLSGGTIIILIIVILILPSAIVQPLVGISGRVPALLPVALHHLQQVLCGVLPLPGAGQLHGLLPRQGGATRRLQGFCRRLKDVILGARPAISNEQEGERGELHLQRSLPWTAPPARTPDGEKLCYRLFVFFYCFLLHFPSKRRQKACRWCTQMAPEKVVWEVLGLTTGNADA